MNFEEWWENNSTKYWVCYPQMASIAKAAWNAALNHAADIANAYPDGAWPPTGIPDEIAYEIRGEIKDD